MTRPARRGTPIEHIGTHSSGTRGSASRPRTTVPQQSLFLLNSPFVSEQAQSLAKRSLAGEDQSAAARLQRLYCFTLARSPTEEERQLALPFVESTSKDQPAGQLDLWEQLAQLLLLCNEFAYVD